MNKERILCAAIWFNDGKKHEHQPINIKIGLVVCGRRHCNCFLTLDLIFPDMKKDELAAHRTEQGFLTTGNRFVDRKEAFKIAATQGQLLMPELYDPKEEKILVSEDLY